MDQYYSFVAEQRYYANFIVGRAFLIRINGKALYMIDSFISTIKKFNNSKSVRSLGKVQFKYTNAYQNEIKFFQLEKNGSSLIIKLEEILGMK